MVDKASLCGPKVAAKINFLVLGGRRWRHGDESGYQGASHSRSPRALNPDGVGNWTIQQSSKEQGTCTGLYPSVGPVIRRARSFPLILWGWESFALK